MEQENQEHSWDDLSINSSLKEILIWMGFAKPTEI